MFKTVKNLAIADESPLREPSFYINDLGRKRKVPCMKPKVINDFVDNLKNHYFSRKVKSNLIELTNLVNRISNYDRSIENKCSYEKSAEKIALEIQDIYTRITEIMPLITEEEAALAIEILHGANIMFLRIIGDKLARVKLENGNNLEFNIKTLYRDETLKEKAGRFHLKQALLKMNPLETEDLNYLTRFVKD